MVQATTYLVNNDGQFRYVLSPKGKQIQIFNIDPNKVQELIDLANSLGLIVSFQGGFTVTEIASAEKPAAKKSAAKK
jgi:hypothetical protein